jgi:hypothetical protein
MAQRETEREKAMIIITEYETREEGEGKRG